MGEGFPGHPLRKDFVTNSQSIVDDVEDKHGLIKSEPITINLGPQHPSTHGVFRMRAKYLIETIMMWSLFLVIFIEELKN